MNEMENLLRSAIFSNTPGHIQNSVCGLSILMANDFLMSNFWKATKKRKGRNVFPFRNTLRYATKRYVYTAVGLHISLIL